MVIKKRMSFVSCLTVAYLLVTITQYQKIQTANLPTSINPVLLAPTNKESHEKLNQEFKALKQNAVRTSRDVKLGVVCLSKAENTELAPTLNAFLQPVVTQLVKKTKLKMPTIFVYIKEDSASYNASMQKVTYTSVLTYRSETGSSISTELVNDEFNLTIGKELINLFFWNSANKDLIEAVLAHEFGHAVNNHTTQSPTNEFEADTTAIKVLDFPQNLPKAIDMLTLAGHIYNNLAAIASESFKEHVHFLIRVMTTSLIQEIPDLGELGNSSSHTNFAFSVNAALGPILKPSVAKGEQATIDVVVKKAYNNLKLACSSPDKLLGGDEKRRSIQGQMLDKLTSEFFSPINHPDPRSRKKHMLEQISARTIAAS